MEKQKIINSFRDEYFAFSNFFRRKIIYNGEEFLTSEHAYQAYKTLDPVLREEIKNQPSPGKAKAKGQELRDKSLLRPDWDTGLQLKIMEEIIAVKFSEANPDLVEILLATGDTELIEGNDWGDTFFGVCNGVGENNLGKLLMKRRSKLLENKFIF